MVLSVLSQQEYLQGISNVAGTFCLQIQSVSFQSQLSQLSINACWDNDFFYFFFCMSWAPELLALLSQLLSVGPPRSCWLLVTTCISQLLSASSQCFTANLRAPRRADLLMLMHQDPSDLPVVTILQLGAKSNLTVMALREPLDLRFSLRKGLFFYCREALPEDRAVQRQSRLYGAICCPLLGG